MSMVMGTYLVDEMDCGNFFDNFDDLTEFPLDNECDVGSIDIKDFPPVWSHSSDDLSPSSDPFFSHSSFSSNNKSNSNGNNSASDLSTEFHVPSEDMMQWEWLSTFVEDSFSDVGLTLGKENSSVKNENSGNQFETSSPISVLENGSHSSSSSNSSGDGSSCSSFGSVEKKLLLSPTCSNPQRARTKRPRPATFIPRLPIQLLAPPSSFIETSQLHVVPRTCTESNNFLKSFPEKKLPKQPAFEQKKKKKIKLSTQPVPTHSNQNTYTQAVRKCLHCEITKTPQWRAGPMGPKTLCNACGVRYKSGRLFPEYRPAASPTFVPSLHSNSHKKVLEMRCKDSDQNSSHVGTMVLIPTTTTKLELNPNNNKTLEDA